jgi:peroxiredoxin Q/BCP
MGKRQLDVGDPAPDFTLRSHTGGDWTLKAALERGPVVLFFYPKDDTPVCIAEACSFRDQHELFTGRGAEVVGVSRDSVESHKSFAGRHDLPFVLLSDTDGAVRELFGVKKTLGFFDGRVTFVIDRGGVIRHAYASALDASAHVEKALKTLSQLG